MKNQFGPGEKSLVGKGEKWSKTAKPAVSEIKKSHAWTPYKPNIFSLTAPALTLHIMDVHEDISKGGKGAGVKNRTVIGGREGRFLR